MRVTSEAVAAEVAGQVVEVVVVGQEVEEEAVEAGQEVEEAVAVGQEAAAVAAMAVVAEDNPRSF